MIKVIFLLAQVVDVAILGNSSTEIYENLQSSKYLYFTEDIPQPVQCIAKGGNPPPEVQLMIGHRDVTEQFQSQIFPRLSGMKGLRLMEIITVMSTKRLVVGPAEDGQKLECKVTVPGLGSHSTQATIQVSCKLNIK